MQLSGSFARSARGAAPSRRSAVVVRAEQDNQPVGQRVQRYLQTPFDILAFGPRSALGLLTTLPERLNDIQNDVNKVMELAQDPRPLDEKGQALFKEVEDRIVDCLDKGITLESGVVSSVKSVLPPEAQSILNEIIPQPPTRDTVTVDATLDPYSYSPSTSSNAPSMTYTQGDVMSSQIASEMVEIKGAVSQLKSALDGVRTNTDVSRTSVLRLTLKDARDQLSRRLNEISPATADDPTIAAANREARILLDEVDASFNF